MEASRMMLITKRCKHSDLARPVLISRGLSQFQVRPKRELRTFDVWRSLPLPRDAARIPAAEYSIDLPWPL
jgi:hypothetical protein